MTDWRSLRGSNFLAPEDLESGPALCTIAEVKVEQMLNDDEKPKKEVAITLQARHRNPETGKAEDLAKTEWVANVVNLTLLEALFGTPHVEQWAGKRMLLQHEPCEVPGRYFGKPSVRVAGSPDIAADIPVDVVLKMKGGKKRNPIHKVLKATKAKGTEASVDPVTGEVADSAEAAGDTGAYQDGDPGAEAAADAFTGPDAANGDSDEELYRINLPGRSALLGIPGRGALFDTDDPDRPATTGDKTELSVAIAHVPTEWTKTYRKRFGGRSNSELTHGEIVAFTAAAAKEALA